MTRRQSAKQDPHDGEAAFQSVAGKRARRAPSPSELGDDAQWEEWRALTPPMPIDEGALDDLLAMPSGGPEATLQECEGDVVILGAGGKMGPTLARMVRRALDGIAESEHEEESASTATRAPRVPRRVVAVSRFSSSAAELA